MNSLLTRSMFRRCGPALLFAWLAIWASQRANAITISAPSNVVLERDMAGQLLPIVIQGTEEIAGMSFVVQIADGGPGPVTQGLIDGPDITAVDLLTGAIFGPNNQGVDDPGSFPQFAQRDVTTQPNSTITLSGQPSILATITLSTVGVAPGTYAVILGGIPAALSSSEFFDGAGERIPPTYINGSVTIVPEPSTALLAVIAGVGIALSARRRSRGRLANA